MPTAANAKDSDLIFPKGQTGPNPNMTGTVWVYNMLDHDSAMTNSVGNVTFEVGARTNWHSHFAGQILLVIDGGRLPPNKRKANWNHKERWCDQMPSKYRALARSNTNNIPYTCRNYSEHWEGMSNVVKKSDRWTIQCRFKEELTACIYKLSLLLQANNYLDDLHRSIFSLYWKTNASISLGMIRDVERFFGNFCTILWLESVNTQTFKRGTFCIGKWRLHIFSKNSLNTCNNQYLTEIVL